MSKFNQITKRIFDFLDEKEDTKVKNKIESSIEEIKINY